ncbi:hypothetical protein HKBW3S42_01295 [Candidatus Hakubella thermalkaliphila]|uniref:Uncharacterized protein n=1 Tax=Candidatus Hakubella thermalkaliphila TaxID=2754717 RepID=A0A6V8Q4B5_9ACTN|nr:hypothetical protein [Candidatus Hakubella thermalkaliphila]GFP19319.1 hypothetical protein HKBW3S03_00824 [Candidatus Hakubella thermalkaliphila]GFP22932.1 hypothetical protein HKBW3S09_00399 [Candidatus Hakubella thermalkaliphila]GFP30593.1 hypothetical protein HKBW3S34_01513 [Candidatus Hakubella thermalkaliphila]GFP32984.1 hypothetical protein HKBW3S42_01295 [Candidatus Hakubella thermalkaliphila]GFP39609.1 hypothetical protein HKBW3S47_01307 [Candidatus Hakubella thermalkaliphila]
MVQIVVLNNVPQGYNYGQEVRFEVHDQHKMDYREAADFLNVIKEPTKGQLETLRSVCLYSTLKVVER